MISCQGAPNFGPGVWFKIVGQGNLTRITTDHPSTTFDTQLSVYCSVDDSCAELGCVAANNDINIYQGNVASELEFCAAIGKTYYILVHGSNSGAGIPESGAFGLTVEEPTDGQGQKIPCVSSATCEPVCVFSVPLGAVSEHDPLPGGLPAYLQADIPCNDTLTGIAASGTNAGCTAPAGAQWKFTPLTIGVAMKGDSHAWNGARDVDWFALEDQLPVQEAFIIDYTFQSTGPMECVPWLAADSFALCHVTAAGILLLNIDTCATPVTWRVVMDTVGTGLDGQPNNDLLFRVRSRATTGYNCASGLNDYWFRINWVLPASECPPVPDPPGVVGVDYDDERDEATSSTFDGTGGESGLQHEPCFYSQIPAGVSKGGCATAWPVISDGEFIRLTPGRPMVGATFNRRDPSGLMDVDWYKFELTERSLVHLRVQSGGPATFVITENSCDNFAITYATATTLGYCGADPHDIEGEVVLDPGVYIVYGYPRPLRAYPDVNIGGTQWAWLDCAPTSITYGLVKYRLDLTATPAPPCCAGNADQLPGLVNFDDIVAVLANWKADYGEGGTGPGDATCGAGDGVVNFEDINAVLANWLSACP